MTSRPMRISAVVCAVLALACVAAWLLAGAPNVPHINLLTDPSADDFYRSGSESVSWLGIWGLAQISPWVAHLTLFMLSTSAATAAVLSLILLVRSDQSDATPYLGVGLGWWSLSIVYLSLFCTVPMFLSMQHWPLLLRIALDVIAFLLILAAAYAVPAFWQRFPRAVSAAELDTFLADSRAKSAARGVAWRRWLHLRLWQEQDAMHPAKGRGGLARAWRIGFAVYAVGGLGALWRGSVYLPVRMPVSDTVYSLFLVFTMLSCIYVLGLPVFKCLRLLKFHRALGSPEDRTKIEWIWAAIWIAVLLCLLPGVVAPVMYLAENWFPELAFDFGWLGMYLLLAFAAAPFIVLVALALSVFYRGAVDPRLALRGFTVWTLLGVVLTLVFVFIERTVATRVVLLMHLPPQTGYVTAGAIVAATFQPIRKRLEKHVNRVVERVLPETLLAAGKRTAAAVAIVDIAGFTALSAQDEQGAILASALVQKEARRLAEARGGRVVKSTGDGVILVFPQAAACLSAVQELYRTAASRAAALDLPPIALHSGLHWGEVVEMHDGDIYGMTVNVAARLADWAKAGEIGASEAFYLQLSPPSQVWMPAGSQGFKNVPQAIACYRLLAG